MKKKLRLKKKVVQFLIGTLTLIVLAVIYTLIFTLVLKEFNRRATKCDEMKGYTCSINELVVVR